jgi:hypothetical protein
MTLFSSKRTEREILERIMEIAQRMDVPLDRTNLTVHRAQGVTYVDASYIAQLEYFPRRYYPWQFVLDIRTTPPRYQLPDR